MKKIIIIAVFICIYQNTFTQNNNNNNSLKQEPENVASTKGSNYLYSLKDLCLIASLYTTHRTKAFIPIDPLFLKSTSYCSTYSASTHGTKTLISPDKKYKVSITNQPHSTLWIHQLLGISNTMGDSFVKKLPLPNRTVLDIQFYNPDKLVYCHQKSSDKTASVFVHIISLDNDMDDDITIRLNVPYIPAISFMPQQELFIMASPTNALNIINAEDGTLIASKARHTSTINAIATHEKIPLIASASDDGTICIWKPIIIPSPHYTYENWICTNVLLHDSMVKSLCINPEGTYLISGTHDTTHLQFLLWDINQKTPLFTFPLHQQFKTAPMPIHCSWITIDHMVNKKKQEIKLNFITLEHETFLYETTPEKLFKVVTVLQKSSPKINTIPTLEEPSKLENDSSTTLESSDLSRDNSPANSSNSSSDNDNGSSPHSSATDNPASIGSGRTPSY